MIDLIGGGLIFLAMMASMVKAHEMGDGWLLAWWGVVIVLAVTL